MINIIKRLQIINMVSLCCYSCPTRSLQDEVSAYNYLIRLVINAWPVCLLPPLSLFIYTSFAFPSSPLFSLLPPTWHLYPWINLFFLHAAPVSSWGLSLLSSACINKKPLHDRFLQHSSFFSSTDLTNNLKKRRGTRMRSVNVATKAE